jgi:hypothetical protein
VLSHPLDALKCHPLESCSHIRNCMGQKMGKLRRGDRKVRYSVFRARPPREKGVPLSCQRVHHRCEPNARGMPREQRENWFASTRCRGTGSSSGMHRLDGHADQIPLWVLSCQALACSKSKMSGENRARARSRAATGCSTVFGRSALGSAVNPGSVRSGLHGGCGSFLAV